MSKKKQQEEVLTPIDNLNNSLTGFTAKVKNNMKIISIIGIIFAVVVVGIIAYVLLIRKPNIKKADNNIAQADRELIMAGNDSTATEMYKKVAEDGYDAGNRAKLMAAIGLYKQHKYDEAIKYLQDYDAKDAIIGAASLSLLGDCYVNTDKLNDAVEAFKKAIDESDSNPYYTPVFMVKLAHIYHEQKKYADEAALYQEIVDKYPQFMATSGINVEKELQRANQLAGK